MKVGDLVRIVTRKRSVRRDSVRTIETYRLSEEKQCIGTVIKMGTTINQMTVLTQEGKVKFWFNHQCELMS
jgi:hypothetical protein